MSFWDRIRNNPKITVKSVTAATVALITYLLITFVGSVPTGLETVIPVVAAFVAGIVVPYDPAKDKDGDGKNDE